MIKYQKTLGNSWSKIWDVWWLIKGVRYTPIDHSQTKYGTPVPYMSNPLPYMFGVNSNYSHFLFAHVTFVWWIESLEIATLHHPLKVISTPQKIRLDTNASTRGVVFSVLNIHEFCLFLFVMSLRISSVFFRYNIRHVSSMALSTKKLLLGSTLMQESYWVLNEYCSYGELSHALSTFTLSTC